MIKRGDWQQDSASKDVLAEMAESALKESSACGNRWKDFATDVSGIAKNLEQNCVSKTQRARDCAQDRVPLKLQVPAEAL